MPSVQKTQNELKNHLRAAFSAEDFSKFSSHLKKVEFKLGDVVYESGQKIEYEYFPTTAIVSHLYIMENGWTAEIGVIGNDGIVGTSLYMGSDTTTSRAIIQSAGIAYSLKAKDLIAEFSKGGNFQKLLLRYTQALISQISQTAVCNRLQSIEQ